RGVLAIATCLLLELGHAAEPAHPGDTVENPGELSVRRHLALVENDVLAGIDPGGEEGRRYFPGLAAQLLGILPERDRVLVDDAEDALVVPLQPDPIADGAQVIAEMEIAGRLHAGKDSLHRLVPWVWRALYRRSPGAGQPVPKAGGEA